MDGPEISLSSPVKPTYGLFGLSKPRDLGAYKLPVQESSLPSQTDTRMSFIRELASLQSALAPSALAIKESPRLPDEESNEIDELDGAGESAEKTSEKKRKKKKKECKRDQFFETILF